MKGRYSDIPNTATERSQANGNVQAAERSEGANRDIPTANASGETAIVVLDRRSLIRDCLVRNLREIMGFDVFGAASLGECLWLASDKDVGLVILSLSGTVDSNTNRDLHEKALKALPNIPILVLHDPTATGAAEADESDHRSSYISTSLPLDVAIAAIRVVQSGRCPPKLVETIADKENPAAMDLQKDHERLQRYFTTRQMAVIDALRKGKANKIIAYELSMRESTVKVHVRNIMKRLNARNRTEVSYIANELAAGRDPSRIEALTRGENGSRLSAGGASS